MYNLNMTWRALGAVAIALLFTTAVFAQQPVRIRGQIEKTDGSTLSLKTRDGSMLDVKVADDARVAALVKASLADCGELPARKREDSTLAEDEAGLFFHDGTERPINRPQDPEEQHLYYSGKQKEYTVKNDVVIDEPCKIRFLSDTVEGKKNDKRLADESGYRVPQGSVLAQDAGFQGFRLAGVAILQPRKKPRGGELSYADKVRNRLISSIRVRIEHAIGGVKRYRIVKDKLRNWKPGFRDLVFETCSGLHNFRLNFRPWHYKPVTYIEHLLKS